MKKKMNSKGEQLWKEMLQLLEIEDPIKKANEDLSRLDISVAEYQYHERFDQLEVVLSVKKADYFDHFLETSFPIAEKIRGAILEVNPYYPATKLVDPDFSDIKINAITKLNALIRTTKQEIADDEKDESMNWRLTGGSPS